MGKHVGRVRVYIGVGERCHGGEKGGTHEGREGGESIHDPGKRFTRGGGRGAHEEGGDHMLA